MLITYGTKNKLAMLFLNLKISKILQVINNHGKF